MSDYAMSVVLLIERNQHQLPTYYVSHLLARADLRYPLIKKFVYALLIAIWKLPPYFDSCHATARPEQPLRNTLEGMVVWGGWWGRLWNWHPMESAMNLGELSRLKLWLILSLNDQPTPLELATSGKWCCMDVICWWFDYKWRKWSRVNSDVTRGLYIWACIKVSIEGVKQRSWVWGIWSRTSQGFLGHQLVVTQVKGEYEAHDVTMVAYLSKVKEKSHIVKKFEIEHVPRGLFKARQLFARWPSKEHPMGNLTSANNWLQRISMGGQKWDLDGPISESSSWHFTSRSKRSELI